MKKIQPKHKGELLLLGMDRYSISGAARILDFSDSGDFVKLKFEHLDNPSWRKVEDYCILDTLENYQKSNLDQLFKQTLSSTQILK